MAPTTAAKPSAALQEAEFIPAAFGPGVYCTGADVAAASEVVALAAGVQLAEETAVVQEEVQPTSTELESQGVSTAAGAVVHSVGVDVHVPVVHVAAAGAVQETEGQSQPVMGRVATTDEAEATRARAEVENFMVCFLLMFQKVSVETIDG
jgi:hypothetical protein